MTNQELDDLAFNIADESAASGIESATLEIEIDGVQWLDFEVSKGTSDWDSCADYVDYLEARGTLHRHPERVGVVRIEEGA